MCGLCTKQRLPNDVCRYKNVCIFEIENSLVRYVPLLAYGAIFFLWFFFIFVLFYSHAWVFSLMCVWNCVNERRITYRFSGSDGTRQWCNCLTHLWYLHQLFFFPFILFIIRRIWTWKTQNWNFQVKLLPEQTSYFI